MTRGQAAAVLLVVVVGFAVIGTIFARSATDSGSTWPPVPLHHRSSGSWVSVLAAVGLAWAFRAWRRASERRLELRLRPVEALVVARRWRPAPHAPLGSWAQRSA